MKCATYNNQQLPSEPLEAGARLEPAGPKRSSSDNPKHNLAPLIAFVGCDGAGKSTVSDAILAWMQASRSTQSCHLGVQSKALGEAMVKWPLVGKRIARLIADNSPRVSPAFKKDGEGPSTLAAFAIFLLSLRRWRRYQKMMALRRKGVAVVADRFPQIAVANLKIDGPGLANVTYRNAFVRFLAGREKALYAYMISYRPDLVIRLNVDLETAFARKPDHRYESLALKIANVPKLEYQGAPILDLDSRLPLADVIAQAKAGVSRSLSWPHDALGDR
ncbi:nucleoside triphosphate hydrolase [Pseudomonas typographi]|nr:nucleoside triphosphate hydrolase [Pseudomonas typographi]